VFHFFFKFHKDAILQVFGLEESFLVKWAIEKTWEAKIPHEVFDVLFAEKVSIEVMRKVIHQQCELLRLHLRVNLGNAAMEKAEELMVCIDDFMA